MKSVGQQSRQSSYWEKRRQESCPLCDGIGFRMVVRQGEVRAQKCRCVTRDRIESLLAQSGIPSMYRNGSLLEFSSRSLEEITLVDSLRDILNEREPATTFRWVIPHENLDAQRIVSWFAADLVRFQGYSCLWISRLPVLSGRHSVSRQISMAAELVSKSDFLFIELEPGDSVLTGRRRCQPLEEYLKERLHRRKSILLLGQAPRGFEEAKRFFRDERLAGAVIRDFRIIDPAQTDSRAFNNRWLF